MNWRTPAAHFSEEDDPSGKRSQRILRRTRDIVSRPQGRPPRARDLHFAVDRAKDEACRRPPLPSQACGPQTVLAVRLIAA